MPIGTIFLLCWLIPHTTNAWVSRNAVSKKNFALGRRAAFHHKRDVSVPVNPSTATEWTPSYNARSVPGPGIALSTVLWDSRRDFLQQAADAVAVAGNQKLIEPVEEEEESVEEEKKRLGGGGSRRISERGEKNASGSGTKGSSEGVKTATRRGTKEAASGSVTKSRSSSTTTTTKSTLGSGGGGSNCFPGDAWVEVYDETAHRWKPTAMNDLELGDRVRTGISDVSTVYAFGTRDPSAEVRFYRLWTTSGQFLELTENHIVFLEDEEPTSTTTLQNWYKSEVAWDIDIGDKLRLLSPAGDWNQTRVVWRESVQKQGA